MSAGFLLDTNVLSALGPGGADLSRKAIAWIARREASLAISAVSITEIESGLEKLRLKGVLRRAAEVETWFAGFLKAISEGLIGLDQSIAAEAGRLIAREYAAGRRPEFADALIGATAKDRDLVLLTRNVRHFETFGINVIDPFSI